MSEIEEQFLSKSKFSKLIEKTVIEKSIGYMEAILLVCEKNKIEPEDVRKFVSPIIRDKLEAEAGSFTNATVNLNLSQSAISRQIQSLEQDLKVQLFERHARGLTLTENGEYVFKTAHEVISKLKEVETSLAVSYTHLTLPTTPYV